MVQRKRSNRRKNRQNGGSFRKKVAAVAEDIKNIFKSDKELQRIYHSKGGDEKVRKMIKSRNWARGISGTLLTIALALAVYSTAVKGKGGVVKEKAVTKKKRKMRHWSISSEDDFSDAIDLAWRNPGKRVTVSPQNYVYLDGDKKQHKKQMKKILKTIKKKSQRGGKGSRSGKKRSRKRSQRGGKSSRSGKKISRKKEN